MDWYKMSARKNDTPFDEIFNSYFEDVELVVKSDAVCCFTSMFFIKSIYIEEGFFFTPMKKTLNFKMILVESLHVRRSYINTLESSTHSCLRYYILTIQIHSKETK